MRERTTWNTTDITKRATVDKTADPYQMNQDHGQPPADDYLTGDPSAFAEDVHPNNWDVEYDASGQTKRDDIGMPEKRPETYTHPEKTAGEMDQEFLVKKADLCVKVARMMLAGKKFADEKEGTATIEDQAVALMSLPDADLINTHNRLAQQQQDDDEGQQSDDEGQQAKQAQQQQDGDDEAKQSQQDEDEGQQQKKQATDEMKAKATKIAASIQAGNKEEAQAALRELVAECGAFYDTSQQQQVPQQAPPQAQQAQQQEPQQDMGQQAQIQQQVQDMVQEAMQQQAPPQAQQAQQQLPQEDMGQQAQDEVLLDQMLAPEEPAIANEVDIQMEPAAMDMDTDVVLSNEDEVLRTLFAENQDEGQGQQQQDDDEQKKQASDGGFKRTASTATVGTKPSAGVSRIGGNGAPAGAGSDDKLSSLWSSAPDVREAFGLK